MLFLIFINDIGSICERTKICLFADDTTIHNSSKNLVDALDSLHLDLTLFSKWFEENRLVVNWSKTKAMVVNRHEVGLPENIILGDNKIEFVRKFKLLGVVVDSRLMFSDHVGAVCKRVNYTSFLFCRNTKFFSFKFKTVLFKLFIFSNFDYCSSVFSLVSKSEMKRLESCFNRSLRQLLRISVDRINLSNSVFQLAPLRIVPLRIRFFQRYSMLVYRVFSRGNVKSILTRVKKCARSLRFPFIQPEFSSKYGETSFSNVAARLLNKFIYSFIGRPTSSASCPSDILFRNLINNNFLFYFEYFKDIF